MKNLTKNLYNLKTDGSLCDVQLHLQGSVIWVHACILGSASPYFMELFKSSNCLKSNIDSHWCSRKPLKINLNEALSSITDLCLICVKKIIDFLYLNELVILQGHLEHFRKITQHLKVLDLLPLCESYSSKIINNQERLNEINTAEISTKCNADLEKTCELQCCISNDPNLLRKVRKNEKRLLTCQVCNHTSISIKKMLKHLECSNHFSTNCPICFYKVKTEKDFIEHTKEHSNSQPFFCSICNKRNKFFEHHINHLKVHCRNKKFFCEVCHKGFTSHKNLTAHLKIHGKQYICNKCDYITSKLNLFENHLLQHNQKINGLETNDNFISGSKINPEKTELLSLKRKFNCKVCDKGFTQKKNLKRHVQLNHLSVSNYYCPLCSYVSKRTDLFRCHMKKHHNYVPDKEREMLQKEMKKLIVNKCPKEVLSQTSNNLSMMIPVQLERQIDVHKSNSVTKNSKSIVNYKTLKSTSENIMSEQNVKESGALKKVGPQQSIVSESNIDQFEASLHTDPRSLTSGSSDFKENFDRKYLEENKIFPIINNDENNTINNTNNEPTLLGINESIWLNESTGEFINKNHLINVQLIESESPKKSTENSSLSLGDHVSKLIFNDQSSGIPLFELGDETEDLQTSNPQTPQASLVELDDQDFLFSWNNLDSSFCSTWILNEATGELNMVSFNIQPINTELKLSENTDKVSSLEDDETALFLNEGTGDLSVIYFNPNKTEYNIECSINNQSVQNAMETLSEHSNDEFDNDDDLLNEEFLVASANFMAHEENETFLNELTGELNITNLTSCQSQMQDNQEARSESIYLNEETGELTWNVLDNNVENDLFIKSEHLNFDFEDSLNCDEYEQFSTDLGDISSQFTLESNSTNNWHIVDEPPNIMLNEFTGELIKKI